MRCSAHAEAADGVALDGAAIRHIAARAGQAGLVELWPPVPADPRTPKPMPRRCRSPRRAAAEPRTRLARAIAATIAGWLDAASGWSRAAARCAPATSWCWCAAATPSSRDLVRALKQRGVPVAGADRLALAEQLAVQDLVALGQFLLLPEDDLTLATVLKGPLFGIAEDELFLLAYDRGEERLWTPAAPPRAANIRRLRAAARAAARRCWPAPISCRPSSSTPRSSAPGGGRRAHAGAARPRGGRSDRRVPRAGARL